MRHLPEPQFQSKRDCHTLKEVPHGGAKFRGQTLQVYKKQMNT